jgi:hypothetical protein
MKLRYIINGLVCLFGTLLLSCNKIDPGMDEMKDHAKLIFINAAPDVRPPVGNRFLGLFANFNGLDDVIQPLQFPWTSQYLPYTPGQYTIRIDTARTANATIPGRRATVHTLNMTMEADKYYSLFAIDSAQRPTHLLITDDMSLPARGKVKVRFLNVSPDAGPIDIVNAANGNVLAARLTYRQVNQFVEIDPADMPNVRIRDSNTGVFISPANRRILLEANNVYTIWATGVRNARPGVTHTLRLAYIANRYRFQ